MIRYRTLLANIIVALIAIYPHHTLSEEFTSAHVLNWSDEQQDGYFQASVTMIGIVATQVKGREHIADCIDGWFGGGDASQPKRSARIRDVMKGLPDYHPQAVILAVIEKECGEF